MTEPLGRPAAPIRCDAEVTASAADGVANFRLTLRVPGWPGFEPGQFAMLSPGARAAAERHDPLLPRPMAIYRAAERDGVPEIEIASMRTGRGPALLAAARPGDRVRVVGPLGCGFPEPGADARAILVGGGTGIASLFELARRAHRKVELCILLGARSEADLLGRADFDSLGAALEIATEDGSAGHRGRVTDLLEAQLAGRHAARVYACGPTPMMRAASELAARAGRPCLVSLENPMACGFGVCLGCAAPLRGGGVGLVCRDGPVFDAAEIDWRNLA